MFIQLKVMMSPLNGEKLQHAKDTVTVGRMGKAGAMAKKPGAKQRGNFRRYSSGAGDASCEVLVKGTMQWELSKWSGSLNWSERCRQQRLHVGTAPSTSTS